MTQENFNSLTIKTNNAFRRNTVVFAFSKYSFNTNSLVSLSIFQSLLWATAVPIKDTMEKWSLDENIQDLSPSSSSSSEENSIAFNVTLTNNTITFLRQSFIRPTLTTLDMLILAPVMHSNFLFLLILLLLRTALAVVEGILTYISEQGVNVDIVRVIRDVIGQLLSNSQQIDNEA
ncbi:hypothetical protein ABEB36_001137 [Hypothenemus hampei]|uniref:Uncharacterized protein n=1 Tax=Hypothenemus hampei TaxID=57062 RepID=A0ABD1FE81_HYPHA